MGAAPGNSYNIKQNHADIIIRVATEADRDNLLEFIRKNYYPEEPITIGNEPKAQSAEDEEFTISLIQYDATIIATDSKNRNKIVGALVAGPTGPNEATKMIEESKQCKSNKWSEILQLLAYLDRAENIYERYNVLKALYVHAWTVDKPMRGKSIGARLMQKCFEVGKTLGYPLVTCDCSGIYSIRIADQIQMECVGQWAYTDYTGENGKQIFRLPLPHTHVKTFTKAL